MDHMTTKTLSFSPPRLGFGIMRLPLLDRADEGAIDKAQVDAMVDYAMENGVNYFDTAYMYHKGLSEGTIGESLARYPRESYFLCDKMPLWNCEKPGDAERIFEEQLSRCKVDYFDVYLFHCIDDERLKTVEELNIYEFLKEQKNLGRIKNLGFSFHGTLECFYKVIDNYEWDVVQIQLNYLDWELQNAQALYERLCERGIDCIVMEPVRGGLLAAPPEPVKRILKNEAPGCTGAALALRWVHELPGATIVLSGMSSIEQMRENVATLADHAPLTPAERDAVLHSREALKKVMAVPCTGCSYCMDCPFGVNIPVALAQLNLFTVSNDREALAEYLALAAASGSGPESCTECGVCKTHCPQNIDIPAALKKLAGS